MVRIHSLHYIKRVGFKNKAEESTKRYVVAYRHVAFYLTYLFQFLPFTPNGVSLLAALTIFVGCVCFTGGTPWFFLLGVAMLYLGEVLDYVDGSLARTLNKTSKIMWKLLDDFFHEIPRQFLFLFIGLGGYLTTAQTLYLYMGIVATVSQLLLVYLSELRKAIVSNVAGIRLFNEDPAIQQDNPFFGKKEKALLNVVVYPMKQIKLIMLMLTILSFWIPSAVFYSLFFYAPFLSIRLMVFFVNTYSGMMKVEKSMQSKGRK